MGIPTFTSFQRFGKRAGLYVGTEKNVVAAVNPKNGQIIWRHLLEKNDKLRYLSADDQTVTTISGISSPHVRLWDSSTGTIVWDYEFTSVSNMDTANGSTDSVTVPVSGTSVDDILVLTPGGTLTRISGKLGSLVWQTDIAREIQINAAFSRITLSGNSVFAVGVKTVGLDRAIAIVEIDRKSGAFVGEVFKDQYHYFPRSLRPPSIHPEFFFSATGNGNDTFVVWNSAGSSSPVKAMALGSSGQIFDIDVQAALKSDTVEHYAVPLKSRGREFIIKSTGRESAIAKFSQGNGLEIVYLFPDTEKELTTVLFTLALGEKCRPLAARIHTSSSSKDSAIVDLYDIETGDIFGPINVPVSSSKDGTWTKVFIDAVPTTGTAAATTAPFRLLAIFESGAVAMVKPNEILWERDESLANVAGSLFVELPESQMLSLEKDELDEPVVDTDALSPSSRYIRRWILHSAQLRTYISKLPQKLTDIFKRPFAPPKKNSAINTTELVFRDTLGFRKLVVFVSEKGKLQAMETESGTVVWSRWIGPVLKVRQIELARSGVVKFPPVVTVVVETLKTTIIFSVDALTGTDFAAPVTHDTQYLQIIRLPVKESMDHLDVLALVAGDSKVRLHPSTPESAVAFETIRTSFYFYRTSLMGSSVEGFICDVDQRDNYGIYYPTTRTWSLNFVAGEKVAAVSERQRSEKHASLGRVLGSRSVLYKYLNPNILAVATVRETSSSGKTNLYLYLLDTVTGAIYHRSFYLGAGHAAPGLPSIHLLQSDNSVFLSYYNHGPDAAEIIDELEPVAKVAADVASENGRKRKKRGSRKRGVVNTAPDVKGFEIVALEVYESKTPDTRMKGNEYSSFDSRRPQVLSQSFVFPHAITAVGITSTGAGITTREVLFGLASSQLLGVNRRILDPRRPIGSLTSDDKEEMLIPYRPLIDYNPRDVASYSLEIMGIEKIVSSPSSLESTSLVLAYGIDIFFVRRSPSKSFDVLSEDFNYSALILTMLALAASIQVAKHFAQRKRLNDQWS